LSHTCTYATGAQGIVGAGNRPVVSLLDMYRAKFSSSSITAAKEGQPPPDASNDAAAAGPESSSTPEEEAPPLDPEQLKTALNEATEALEAERKKGDDMKDRLMRTLADMENLRERTARQMSEARQFASADVVKSLLEVADNLERAAGSVAEGEVSGGSDIDLDRALSLLRSLRDGVVMTDSILMKVLSKHGVTRYNPMGQPFDPNLHAALFQVPDATKDPGTVAVVIKKGYMLHDRPLRAAEVGVAQSDD
jgi:molecular chaperone GrpE